MLKNLYRIFFISLAIFLFTACQNPADSNDSKANSSNQSGQPVPDITYNGDAAFGGILATISFEFETAPNFPVVVFNMGYAYFGDGISAGEVSVNSTKLEKEGRSGSTWYTSFSQTNPANLTSVSFNGSAHNWDVKASDKVPAFALSVKSPTALTITAPQSGSTSDVSNGLTIRWNGSQAADSILVVLVDLDNSKTFTRASIPFNDFKTVVSAGDLSGFKGDALMQVVRYNASIKVLNDKYYVAVAEIVKQTTISIK